MNFKNIQLVTKFHSEERSMLYEYVSLNQKLRTRIEFEYWKLCNQSSSSKSDDVKLEEKKRTYQSLKASVRHPLYWIFFFLFINVLGTDVQCHLLVILTYGKYIDLLASVRIRLLSLLLSAWAELMRYTTSTGCLLFSLRNSGSCSNCIAARLGWQWRRLS